MSPAAGTVAVSGETFTVTGMSMIRVEDGMVAEGWNEWDRLRMATTCRIVAPA